MAVAKECSLPLESSSWVDWRVAWFARLDRPLSTGVSVLRSSPVFLWARTGCLAIVGYNPERSTGFPVTKLDSIPLFSISPSREQTPFVSVSFFFLFGADLHLRIVSDRSLTQIDRDGESKRFWKDCYKNDWTSNISKSASVVGNYTRFLSREAALGLTCYFMLIDSLYLRIRPLDAGRP